MDVDVAQVSFWGSAVGMALGTAFVGLVTFLCCVSGKNPTNKSAYLTGFENLYVKLAKPTRPQVISGMIVLTGRITLKEVRERLGATAQHHRRMRQCVERVWYFPLMHRFVDDADYCIENHVHKYSVDTEVELTDDVLKRVASEIIPLELDPLRPLWSTHLVTSTRDSTRSALVLRISHCVGDGIAANLLLAACTVDADGVPFTETLKQAFVEGQAKAKAKAKTARRNKAAAQARSHPLARLVNVILRVPRALVYAVRWIAMLLFDFLYLSHHRKTILNKPETVAKQINWSTRTSLNEMKAIKDGLGVSLNDLVVSCISGAIRRLCVQRCIPIPPHIFVPIPVTMRRTVEDVESLMNHTAGIWHFLPLNPPCPVERARLTSTTMARRKYDVAYLYMTLVSMDMWGYSPAWMNRAVVPYFMAKAPAIITNVMGPDKPLYFASHSIEHIHIFGLQGCQGGLSISILSFNGAVSVSLVADDDLVPTDQPDTVLIDLFHQELDLARERSLVK